MSTRLNRVVFILVQLSALLGLDFAHAHDFDISIAKNLESSAYDVNAKFQSHASPRKVWKILTNYEQLPSIVPQILTSKILKKNGTALWLAQEGQETIFFFIKLKFRTLLEITEIPFEQIIFHDMSKQDFSIFNGSWLILQKGKLTEISYILHAKPNFDPIEFFTKSIMKRNIEAMLQSLKNEMDG